jgi:hypothetical protein
MPPPARAGAGLPRRGVARGSIESPFAGTALAREVHGAHCTGRGRLPLMGGHSRQSRGTPFAGTAPAGEVYTCGSLHWQCRPPTVGLLLAFPMYPCADGTLHGRPPPPDGIPRQSSHCQARRAESLDTRPWRITLQNAPIMLCRNAIKIPASV